MNVKLQGLIYHDVNWYQKSINVLTNASKIFIMHHCTLKSFTYGEKNLKKKTLFNCGCRFIHLWQHSFTSEIILLVYITFYCITSHSATQKREILETFNKKGFNVVLAIFQPYNVRKVKWSYDSDIFDWLLCSPERIHNRRRYRRFEFEQSQGIQTLDHQPE